MLDDSDAIVEQMGMQTQRGLARGTNGSGRKAQPQLVDRVGHTRNCSASRLINNLKSCIINDKHNLAYHTIVQYNSMKTTRPHNKHTCPKIVG